MKPFKDRKIISQSVDVYRNLSGRGGLWSIRQRGLVVAHSDHIMLNRVQFCVQPGGHARALKSGQRNVHAFARGIIVEDSFGTDRFGKLPLALYYDLKLGKFRSKISKNIIEGAAAVVFNPQGAFAAVTHGTRCPEVKS